MSEAPTAEPGGTDWELGQAWTMIATARTAGDSAAEQVGWTRYSDGLRNRVSGALADQLIPMLLELRGMRAERDTDARIFDHKLDMLMTLAEGGQALLGKFEARLALLETHISEWDRQHAADMAAIRGKLKDVRSEMERISHENIQDQLSRDERIALTATLRAMSARWPEVVKLLDDHAAER